MNCGQGCADCDRLALLDSAGPPGAFAHCSYLCVEPFWVFRSDDPRYWSGPFVGGAVGYIGYEFALALTDEYPFTWQMVSTVRGTLRPDCDAFDLLRATFPGGSMTGAPKIEAMKIIARLEPGARGVLGGHRLSRTSVRSRCGKPTGDGPGTVVRRAWIVLVCWDTGRLRLD